MKQENIGSSFDDFLREDGIYEEVTAAAIKRVVARQINNLPGRSTKRYSINISLNQRWPNG